MSDRDLTRLPGNGASWPWEIPLRGWGQILGRIWQRNLNAKFSVIAAGVAFFTMLSIFPAITFFVTLYGYVADPDIVSQHTDALKSVLPPGGWEILDRQISQVAEASRGRLGLGLLISVAVTLYTSGAGLRALVDALNIVYHEREGRGLLGFNALVLTFTVGAFLTGLFSLGVIVAVPVVLEAIQLGGLTRALITYLPWVLLILVMNFAIGALFRFGPSRKFPRVKWISLGSVLATLVWFALSLGFSYYVSEFGAYNKVYGTLGAVAALLVWFWLSSYTVILGAALNAEIEHQTKVDTTVGQPRPMGQRGAYMADHMPSARGPRG